MKRSLTNSTIGNYQITRKRNSWECVGINQATGRLFQLREIGTGRWFLNLPNSASQQGRNRHRIWAGDLEDAIQKVESRFFGSAHSASNGSPEVADIFNQWMSTLQVRQTTLKDDYARRVAQFVKWTDKKKIQFWYQIKPLHLEQYAKELAQAGQQRETIEKRCRVVKRGSVFASKNYPEFLFPILDYTLPKRQSKRKRMNRKTLRFDEGFEFLLFLREQPAGWNILPGVALEVFASIRHQEMRQLKWEHFDAKEKCLKIGDIKNDESVRDIPLPMFLVDILNEARVATGARSKGQTILVTSKKDSFRNSWNRYWNRYKPDWRMPPMGMRRSMIQEFIRRDRYSMWVDLYRGRKPDSISAVDWVHYLEKMEFDSEGIRKNFQERVVKPLDEWCEEYRVIWNQRQSNVLPFPTNFRHTSAHPGVSSNTAGT